MEQVLSDSWKASLPCTRAEADALRDDIPALAMLAAPPVLMTTEPDPNQPDSWRLDGYFEDEPSAEDLALLQSLVPSARNASPSVERLADADWISLSQQGLEPIRAGRVLVHTPAHRGQAAAGD